MKKSVDRCRTFAVGCKYATERREDDEPAGLESPGTEKHGKASTNATDMPEFQKLPDPWLYDTQALIADLDFVRELILKIPMAHNCMVVPSNAAIAAVWDLRERLREMAALQAEKPAALVNTHAPPKRRQSRKKNALKAHRGLAIVAPAGRPDSTLAGGFRGLTPSTTREPAAVTPFAYPLPG